jgi:hypothetical protein
MSDAGTNGEEAATEPVKAWQPSRRPAYKAGDPAPVRSGIKERSAAVGPVAAIARFLRRPFVKIILGMALFIAAAIGYDAAVNYRSWTERQDAPKATPHKGIPKTPPGEG